MTDERAAETTHESFPDLMAKVRNRDQAAAAELVRRYEPAVRRVVRIRLGDDRLQRYFDSMDVCQSVLGSFFVRAALGEYELQTADQLMKLLAKIARNKVASQVRKERADRRDHRRVASGDDPASGLAGVDATPSRVLEGKELLAACWERLTPEERSIADLRGAGVEWGEIARRLGDSPEAVRKRFSRAVDQIAQWVEAQ